MPEGDDFQILFQEKVGNIPTPKRKVCTVTQDPVLLYRSVRIVFPTMRLACSIPLLPLVKRQLSENLYLYKIGIVGVGLEIMIGDVGKGVELRLRHW